MIQQCFFKITTSGTFLHQQRLELVCRDMILVELSLKKFALLRRNATDLQSTELLMDHVTIHHRPSLAKVPLR